MAEALTYNVLLYLEIFVDEIRTILQVCHYTADMGSSKHHGIRLFLIEENLYGSRIQQIKLLVTPANKISVTSLFKVFPYSRTHKPIVTGYIYFG